MKLSGLSNAAVRRIQAKLVANVDWDFEDYDLRKAGILYDIVSEFFVDVVEVIAGPLTSAGVPIRDLWHFGQELSNEGSEMLVQNLVERNTSEFSKVFVSGVFNTVEEVFQDKFYKDESLYDLRGVLAAEVENVAKPYVAKAVQFVEEIDEQGDDWTALEYEKGMYYDKKEDLEASRRQSQSVIHRAQALAEFINNTGGWANASEIEVVDEAKKIFADKGSQFQVLVPGEEKLAIPGERYEFSDFGVDYIVIEP